MKTNAFIAGALLTTMLLGAGCAQTSGPIGDRGTAFLPDHITNVQAETLPRAIYEARLRGLAAVQVSDPLGNRVTAILQEPTHTTYHVYSTEALSDAETFITSVNLGEDRRPVRDIQTVNENELLFTQNSASEGDIAVVIYEIFNQKFHIDSTTNWIIDLLADAPGQQG